MKYTMQAVTQVLVTPALRRALAAIGLPIDDVDCGDTVLRRDTVAVTVGDIVSLLSGGCISSSLLEWHSLNLARQPRRGTNFFLVVDPGITQTVNRYFQPANDSDVDALDSRATWATILADRAGGILGRHGVLILTHLREENDAWVLLGIANGARGPHMFVLDPHGQQGASRVGVFGRLTSQEASMLKNLWNCLCPPPPIGVRVCRFPRIYLPISHEPSRCGPMCMFAEEVMLADWSRFIGLVESSTTESDWIRFWGYYGDAEYRAELRGRLIVQSGQYMVSMNQF